VLLQDYRDGVLGRISLETPLTRSAMLAAEQAQTAAGARTALPDDALPSRARLTDAEFPPGAADRPDRFLLLALNSFFWVPILVFLAVLKLLLPFRRSPAPRPAAGAHRRGLDRCNSGWMALTQKAQWDVQGIDGLDPRGWYLVNCNHQSWADILVLQHLLTRRIPLLKFFLKQQLLGCR
jgi:hypothetical protein